MFKSINKKILELGFEVADNTNALLAYWDNQMICRFANNSYYEWFGIKPEDMIGCMHIKELLGDELYLKNLPFLQAALAGKTQVFERDIRLPSGDMRPSIATYCPDVEDNEVKGFFVHVADVTYIKKRLLETNDSNIIPGERDAIKDIENILRSCVFTGFPGIQELAKLHYISESKLKTKFKQRYQKTVFDYFRHLQMEVAERYITERKFNKKQVALMLNFANPSNFSACYNKYLTSKAAEKNLVAIRKASAEQYEAFITQSPFAIAMLNTRFQYLTASKKWLTDFHIDQPNITGVNLLDQLPRFAELFKPVFADALQGTAGNGEDLFLIHDNKTPTWLKWDIRPWYTIDNIIGGILVFAENTTALKEQQQENEKIFEIFTKTSEVARIGAWKRNFKTGTFFWNKITRQILEVPDDYSCSLESSLNFYKEGNSRQLIKDAIQKAVQEAVPFDVVTELITSKGKERKVRVIGYPLFNAGTCEKLLGIIQDITDLKD